ncbi:hypothetical protein [Fulvivirga sediminis]|uniref:Uncharacterized protein n=1 Tax=Fulvivirga sediminis TaxID=2803949 RepID=A0A937K1I4_9BACT|nr:hypothetical protein [Fulvivirga sediminis]MBL3658644.1 hypothetical protein [Fulvivirga sediminis]
MKATSYIILAIICSTFACNSDDSLSTSELENRIERLQNEINKTIDLSTGKTSKDCRIKYIPGGNGCGPIYVYGILGIDTLELKSLFDQLSGTQAELYNLEGGPVCDLAFPTKDSLINGTCRACFEKEGNYECF